MRIFGLLPNDTRQVVEELESKYQCQIILEEEVEDIDSEDGTMYMTVVFVGEMTHEPFRELRGYEENIYLTNEHDRRKTIEAIRRWFAEWEARQ